MKESTQVYIGCAVAVLTMVFGVYVLSLMIFLMITQGIEP